MLFCCHCIWIDIIERLVGNKTYKSVSHVTRTRQHPWELIILKFSHMLKKDMEKGNKTKLTSLTLKRPSQWALIVNYFYQIKWEKQKENTLVCWMKMCAWCTNYWNSLLYFVTTKYSTHIFRYMLPTIPYPILQGWQHLLTEEYSNLTLSMV